MEASQHTPRGRQRLSLIFPAEIHILNYANMGSGVSAHGHGSTRMRSRGISSRQQRHRPRRRQQFGVSNSPVHKDLTERLEKIGPALNQQVRQLLDRNKAERHIRGGMATRRKYKGT